jgi:phage-related baseplate assembly protein
MHAPDVFRSLKRAVTAADYVALARDFNGVAKVKARSENWNEVTLIVSPQGGGRVSDVLRANLLAYFEDKRQVTTRVVIEDATYVEVYISADIKIEPYYDEQTVKENVRKAAASLLAFETVDFGSTVYLSKFYDVIEDVDGVVFVTITEFGRDTANPGSVEQDGVITITDDEIPVIPAQGLYTTGINLTVLQDV